MFMRIVSVLVIAACFVAGSVIAQPSVDAFKKKCIQIDPTFPYYQNRSWDSVAEEVVANGFTQVAITGTSPEVAKPELVAALKSKGLSVRLLYGPLNAYYVSCTKWLPEGWEKWRVQYYGKDPFAGEIAFFCPNEPAVRTWRKKEVTDAVLNCPGFDVVDIGEVFYIGEKDTAGNYTSYSCVCPRCVNKFIELYPECKSLPDFSNPKSVYYWKENTELYRKWTEFRLKSAVDYQNDLVNGKGGLRERCPNVKLCTWSLGNSTPKPDPVGYLAETQASDGAEIVRVCRPDSHCIQTNAPDWGRADLADDYPLEYKPFMDAIKKVNPKLPLSMQTEIGSVMNMRRTRDWYDMFDKTARDSGFSQTMGYMHCLFKDIADKKPLLYKARLSADGKVVTLVFTKRLDKKTAEDPANYTIPGVEFTAVKSDGNLVILTTKGMRAGDVVVVNKCADDPTTRHFAKQLPIQNIGGPYKMKTER